MGKAREAVLNTVVQRGGYQCREQGHPHSRLINELIRDIFDHLLAYPRYFNKVCTVRITVLVQVVYLLYEYLYNIRDRRNSVTEGRIRPRVAYPRYGPLMNWLIEHGLDDGSRTRTNSPRPC